MSVVPTRDPRREEARHCRRHPGGLGIIASLWRLTNPPLFAILAYLGGAVAIAYTSWKDDLHPLPNWLRFGVHSGAALLAMAFISYWHSMSVPC